MKFIRINCNENTIITNYQKSIQMRQNHRHEIKQSKLPIIRSKKSGSRIFTKSKSQPKRLQQKKTHLLLMKWNDLLQRYHIIKQLEEINNSINTVNTHLKRKKQELIILNVPFIQSEQASIRGKQNQQQKIIKSKCQIIDGMQNQFVNDISNIKGIMKTKSSVKMSNKAEHSKSTNTDYEKKIVISIQLSEYDENIHNDRKNKSNENSQNFTDEDDETEKNSRKSSNEKNSRSSFGGRKLCHSKDSVNQRQLQNRINQVDQNLLKTAHFSFSGNHSKQKNLLLDIDNRKNKQNIHNHSCQLKSRKVQMLLKFQKQKEIRRSKIEKVMKEDQQYLNKFLRNR